MNDRFSSIFLNIQEDLPKRLHAIRQQYWAYPMTGIEAFPPLILDKSPEVRIEILRHMNTLLNEFPVRASDAFTKSIPQLLAVYEDNNDKVREQALELLLELEVANISEVIERALGDSDPLIRIMALPYVPHYSGIQQIIPMLYDSNELVVVKALNLVKKYRLQIPKPLQGRFEYHQSLNIKIIYAQIVLEQALDSGEHGNPDVFDYLINGLPDLQGQAINTLAKLGDPNLSPYLPQKLEHEDENIVIEALKAIKKLQITNLKHAVISKLSDEKNNIRQMALETLAVIGDYSDFNLILGKIHDNVFVVRDTAYGILEVKLDPRSIIPLLDRLRTIPTNERNIIAQILDKFPIEQLMLPLIRIYRTYPHPDFFILEKIDEYFGDEHLKLKYLKKISISYLIEIMHYKDRQTIAFMILRAWGHFAYHPLQLCLEKLAPDKTTSGRALHKKIADFITHFEAQHQVQLENNFKLLL